MKDNPAVKMEKVSREHDVPEDKRVSLDIIRNNIIILYSNLKSFTLHLDTSCNN
jgi:hypothetical protein